MFPSPGLQAAVAAAVICYCAASVYVPLPTVTPSDDVCVAVNTTMTQQFVCEGEVDTTVQWLIGDFPLIDGTLFRHEGVTVEDSSDSNKTLIFGPAPDEPRQHGLEYSFDSFNDDNFTVSCMAVRDSFFVNRTDTIQMYQNFAPVNDPTWKVVNCNGDGSLTLQITYQPPSQVCGGDPVTYTFSVANAESGPTEVGELRYNVIVSTDTKDLTATMTTTDGNVTRTTVTPLTNVNVTCSQPSVMVCANCESTTELTCNTLEGASDDWDCEFVELEDDNTMAGAVRDVRPDGTPGEQIILPNIMSDDCTCSPPPSPTPAPTDPPPAGFIVLAVIGGMVVGIVVGIVVVVLICWFGCRKTFMKISEDERKIEMEETTKEPK